MNQTNPIKVSDTTISTCNSSRFWKTASSIVPWAALLLVTMASTYQFLILGDVPASPANDLAKHVAAILNFKSAFLDGQWLPRLQLAPTEYPDFPLFQYYSTLLGYLSLPFLVAGLKPIVAIALAIAFVRWISATAIYATGRMCGASRAASLTAGISYLLTPYIISNFYGRVALPEATAHGVLPILLYGLVRLYRAPDRIAAVLIVSGIVGLAIAHPIFLLYGTAAAGLLIVIAFRPALAIGPMLILIGAIMLASFQWLPAFIGRENIAVDFIYGSPYYARRFSSFRGLYARPLSLVEEGLWMDGAKLFLTPGILTVPVLILLLAKARERMSIAVLVLLSCFLFLSFPPVDIWQLLPQFTWGLQFPYRLLAFIALFVSIGLILIFPKMNWPMCCSIVALLIWQSFRLLSEPPLPEPLAIDQTKIAETFTNLDYLSVSQPPVFRSDGMLLNFARPIDRHFMVDASDVLLSNNYFSVPKWHVKQTRIRIRGSIKTDRPVTFWISRESSRDAPIDGIRTIAPGEFSVTFAVPDALLVLSAHVRCASDIDQLATKTIVSAVDRIPGNEIEVPAESNMGPRSLHLSGMTVPSDQPVTLWLASPANPSAPLTSTVSVGPGRFETTLNLPAQAGGYMLMRSTAAPANDSVPIDLDDIKVTIRVSDYIMLNAGESPTRFIPSTNVIRTHAKAYQRVFKVEPDVVGGADVKARTETRVELPLAYSPFNRITQRGQPLESMPDFRGLTQIVTREPQEPVVANYRIPSLVWLLMAMGAGTCLLGTCLLGSTVCRHGPSNVRAWPSLRPFARKRP